jgi:hypothetical protein
MFGIFKGELSAMLISECIKAKTNLPEFRLRNFSGRIKCGFVNMSVNRTVPSELFGCRRNAKKYSVFSGLETKNKILFVLARLLIIRNSLKNVRKLCID